MLSINFYGSNGQIPHCVRMGESLYEWLATSDFAQVGRSRLTPIEVDGEKIELPLITLNSTTRSMFIALFNEMVLSETTAMLSDLDNNVAQDVLAPRTYRLKKLIEMLNCLKDGNFSHLQRE